MGSVKSRSLHSDGNLEDISAIAACSSSSYYQSQINQNEKHDSSNGNGGTGLQKLDLRYDIVGSSPQYHPVRQPSVRSRTQQPMPNVEELDRRFAKVLVNALQILKRKQIENCLLLGIYGSTS